MNFVATAAVAAASINSVLAGCVLVANPRSSLNRIYALWGASVAIWNLSAYFACQPGTTRADALIWLRLLQAVVIFLPVTITHLCQTIMYGHPRHWLRWVYLLHAGFAVCLVGTFFMKDIRQTPVGWWAVAGPVFWLYLLSFTALTVRLYIELPEHAAIATPARRGRLRALWIAVITLGILGTNDLMPILGLDRYPGTLIPFIPLGNLGAVFYGAAVAYGVLQHELLDIHLALSRIAAFAVRLLFVSIIGFCLLLVLSATSPGSFDTFEFVSCMVVLIASTLIASITFPKLLEGSTERIERALLGDRFELPDKVRAFTEQMRWHQELHPLLQDLHVLLFKTLGISSYWFILVDETSRSFSIVQSHPDDSRRQIPNLQTDSAVFQYFADGKKSYLALDPSHDHRSPEATVKAREQLQQFGGNLAFPLMLDRVPQGMLIIGAKSNNDKYRQTDIQLIIKISKDIVLVINQILLKNQLLLTKELDLLGRMSRGMAHDLNNLTTPVWTVLQLLTEGVSAEALRAELVPVATRNIQTMREYIKEALFFSENLRPDFQTSRLDLLVQGVVESARQNKRKGKNMEYVLQSCGEVLVEMDQVLIRRLLTNLLANAVDASEDGKAVEVEIVRLVKTDPTRDWIRIRITDHGSGITPENLDRVFQPYFTTKTTGDEDRGFGLGLAICRKIASLHEGNLVVSSEAGKGTIVNLDLPSRQKNSLTSRPTTPATSTA